HLATSRARGDSRTKGIEVSRRSPCQPCMQHSFSERQRLCVVYFIRKSIMLAIRAGSSRINRATAEACKPAPAPNRCCLKSATSRKTLDPIDASQTKLAFLILTLINNAESEIQSEAGKLLDRSTGKYK